MIRKGFDNLKTGVGPADRTWVESIFPFIPSGLKHFTGIEQPFRRGENLQSKHSR